MLFYVAGFYMILRTISKSISCLPTHADRGYSRRVIREKGMYKLNFSYFFVTMALCATAGTALAQTPAQREPGLWEIQVDKNSQAAAAMQNLANMFGQLPAAQRQQMEQAMKNSGISAADPTLIKQCVTPEMAARGYVPYVDDPNMKCTTASGSEGGRFTFSCQSPQGTFKGSGRILDATPKSYRAEMSAQGTVAGLPMSMDMTSQARWLGKDCQGIKPVG